MMLFLGNMRMKNSIALLIFGASLLLPGLALAAVDTTLYIQGPGETILVNQDIVVPESCTVVDSTGGATNFSGHKAICALKVAKDTGVIADFVVTDAGFGFTLDSINGIATTPGWVEFWQLWQNGKLANVGIQGIVLANGDTFQLTYGPWITQIIQVLISEGGGPVTKDIYPRRLDVEGAVVFLAEHQQKDGSFGHPLFTDWAAVALGAYQGDSASGFYAREKLKEWIVKNPISPGSLLTDYERRAMALMSLGIDPFDGTNVNYITAILKEFDGTQFGSSDILNDDIFAAIVLKKAGYEENVTPLLETLPFILSWQKESGSFGSVDLTSAVIQMLTQFSSSNKRDEALERAREYVLSKQESSGGFQNTYSTSWALQAIAALNEDGDSWEIDHRTPEHFLALSQDVDGGLLKEESMENRIWATAYAIPAGLQKTWSDILGDYKNPATATITSFWTSSADAKEAALVVVPLVNDALKEAVFSGEAIANLEVIETEILAIAKRVEELRSQVALVYTAYLAQLEQTQDKVLVQQSDDKVAQLSVFEDESLTLESGTIMLTQKAGSEFTAEAASSLSLQSFFRSSTGQAALALGVGIILFFVLGGGGAILSLVRRPKATI